MRGRENIVDHTHPPRALLPLPIFGPVPAQPSVSWTLARRRLASGVGGALPGKRDDATHGGVGLLDDVFVP